MGLILFLLFMGIPLIEIALFIKIGGAIGVGTTIIVVIVTALLGSWLLRAQGFATMREARQTMNEGQIPLDSVIHGLFLVVAGAFLLTPGFMTDAIGFLLFVPPIRLALGQAVIRRIMASASVTVHSTSQSWQSGPSGGPIIDEEALEDDGEERSR